MFQLRTILVLCGLLFGIFTCGAESIVVSRVIDGDTFEIESGEKIRLIGINAPEISDFYGKESKSFLEDVLLSKQVELIDDPISAKYDRYQRRLCYVFIDGVDVNAKMISKGCAFAYLKYKFSKSKEYEELQMSAMKNNKGIWGYGGQEKLDENNDSEKMTEDLVEESKHFHQVSSKQIILGALILILLLLFFCYLLKK